MVCPTCDVDTVDRLPGPEPTPDVELMPVFATGDPALIALAQSLLDGEKIDYLMRAPSPQGLFGRGRATGYEFGMGTAEFWIRADEAERVKTLLEDLREAEQSRDLSDREES